MFYLGLGNFTHQYKQLKLFANSRELSLMARKVLCIDKESATCLQRKIFDFVTFPDCILHWTVK